MKTKFFLALALAGVSMASAKSYGCGYFRTTPNLNKMSQLAQAALLSALA
jgi:hypothetical protein